MLNTEAARSAIPELESALLKLGESLDIASLESKLADYELEIGVPGFWDDIERARGVMKEKSAVELKLSEYREAQKNLEEVGLLCDMAEEAEDAELAEEAAHKAEELGAALDSMIVKTLLTEEYDANSAIVSVHAGAGGLDAQDWTEMLLRMYARWAELKGYSVKTLDYQNDTEGGIKSATLLIEGEYAYGYLKTEMGVHRLVRISPFNTQRKRQTSFASVDVTPELAEDVKVEISPDELRIDTYRSSGAGGQHVNKTDSAVRITHLPTNIVVSCQNERSQHMNREYAMRMLYAKLYALAKQEHKDKISELKGNFGQISWGSQIRSYVFQPYTLVKDHRTGCESGNVNAVMDGALDPFINASLNAL
ncbi:MAG TPA: peptide chain release factor 2, partial [Bacillota bacterium]|nr:peptide chain release factor 2 [Bacillota bacterium]